MSAATLGFNTLLERVRLLGSLLLPIHLATSTWARPVRADPQVNVGVVPGVGWRPNSKLAFDGHVAGDVLFGRTSDRSFGFGPRWELGTRAFDDLRAAAGVSLQLPTDPFAVVASAHGLVQSHAGDWDPGVGARLFVGLRPYNYYGSYSAGLGVVLGGDHVFATERTNLTIGVHVDGMWLSLPLSFLVAWLSR